MVVHHVNCTPPHDPQASLYDSHTCAGTAETESITAVGAALPAWNAWGAGGAPGAEEVRSGVLSPLGLGAMCAHVLPLQPSSRRSCPRTKLKDEAQVHAVMAIPGHPMDFISSAGLSEQVSPLYGPSLWELRPVQRQLPC